MAVISMAGGQKFDVAETYEAVTQVVNEAWTGSITVTDRSTGVVFTIKVPQIVSVQP